MRRPRTVASLEALGRVRLSQHFFMREFLFSEIAAMHGMANVPDNPDLAIAAGRRLCEDLLEPLRATFGAVSIRSAYRSPDVNEFGNIHGFNCAMNEKNRAGHTWDKLDAEGRMGATACVVIPWFADRYAKGADWRGLAWYIHDHLRHNHLQFFPRLAAFNINWREDPSGRIDSFIKPMGCLTKRGRANHAGSHAEWYPGFPEFQGL